MGLFRLFRAVPSEVEAFIADPIKGPRVEIWTVGTNVSRAVVRKFGVGAELYVIVAYENGTPVTAVVKRDIYQRVLTQFDAIERAAGTYVERPKYDRDLS